MYCKKLQIVYCNKILLLVIIKVIFTNADSGTSHINTDEAGILNQVDSKFFGSANTEFSNIPHRRFGNPASNYPKRSPFFHLGYEKRMEFHDQLPIRNNNQRFYQEGENFQRSFFIEHPPRESSSSQVDTHRSRFKEGYDPNPQKKSNEINQQTSRPDDVLYFNGPHKNNRAANNGFDFIHRVKYFRQPFKYLTKHSQTPIRSDDFKPELRYINQPPVFNTKISSGNNRYLGNRKAIYHKLPNENYLSNKFSNLGRDHSNIKAVIKSPKFLIQRNPSSNEKGLNMGRTVQSHNRIPTNSAIFNNHAISNRSYTFYWKNQNQNTLPDKIEPTFGNKVAILGKPVLVPTETTLARDIDNESSKNAVKKQCVQDCESTSEYNPVCGTDSVTYINPGKFACAHECGIDVKVSSYGSCDDDAIIYQYYLKTQ